MSLLIAGLLAELTESMELDTSRQRNYARCNNVHFGYIAAASMPAGLVSALVSGDRHTFAYGNRNSAQ